MHQNSIKDKRKSCKLLNPLFKPPKHLYIIDRVWFLPLQNSHVSYNNQTQKASQETNITFFTFNATHVRTTFQNKNYSKPRLNVTEEKRAKHKQKQNMTKMRKFLSKMFQRFQKSSAIGDFHYCSFFNLQKTKSAWQSFNLMLDSFSITSCNANLILTSTFLYFRHILLVQSQNRLDHLDVRCSGI